MPKKLFFKICLQNGLFICINVLKEQYSGISASRQQNLPLLFYSDYTNGKYKPSSTWIYAQTYEYVITFSRHSLCTLFTGLRRVHSLLCTRMKLWSANARAKLSYECYICVSGLKYYLLWFGVLCPSMSSIKKIYKKILKKYRN